MMKHLIIAVAMLLSIASVAQDTKTVAMPEPEFMNRIYYYAAGNNALIVLEKGEAEMKTKAKLGGFGGASSLYVINGSKSAVRLKSSDKVSFAVKMDNMMMMDPSSILILYKFEIKGSNRQAVLQESGFRGKNSQQQQGIKCLLKKTAAGTYVFVPEEPLPAGEYGFINTMTPANYNSRSASYTVFAFGVDQ
jgi:hypothetical protein